jgi:hypothetical protein
MIHVTWITTIARRRCLPLLLGLGLHLGRSQTPAEVTVPSPRRRVLPLRLRELAIPFRVFPFGSITAELLGIWEPIPTLGHGSEEEGERKGTDHPPQKLDLALVGSRQSTDKKAAR